MNYSYSEHESLLHVKNVSWSYDDKVILKDINFEIRNTVKPNAHQGQIVAFLGRSGRGKSSLFKLITGLEHPDTGELCIPDFTKPKVNELWLTKKIKEGDVGFVDQKYTLFRHKTIFQALMYALRESAESTTGKEKKINDYIQAWGLENCKNQYPNELSGGQRQRTAILEQLVHSSNYIVLDEPFSGLDVGNIQNVKDAIRLIDSSNDLNTVIFSTHDIELAVELADQIYIIGFPPNESYSTIVGSFDLKALGLGWSKELTLSHRNLINQIRDLLLKS